MTQFENILPLLSPLLYPWRWSHLTTLEILCQLRPLLWKHHAFCEEVCAIFLSLIIAHVTSYNRETNKRFAQDIKTGEQQTYLKPFSWNSMLADNCTWLVQAAWRYNILKWWVDEWSDQNHSQIWKEATKTTDQQQYLFICVIESINFNTKVFTSICTNYAVDSE